MTQSRGDKQRYFRLRVEEVEPFGGFQTAAMASCCACGTFLSGMGGGGTFICEPCNKVLNSGILSREFFTAREELGI